MDANLSTADMHLKRMAEASLDGPSRALAIEASRSVRAVQAMGILVSILHERLGKVEEAVGTDTRRNQLMDDDTRLAALMAGTAAAP